MYIGKILLKHSDIRTCHSLGKNCSREKNCVFTLGIYRHVVNDTRIGSVQIVPGTFVHRSCLGKSEDLLERPHGICRLLVVSTCALNGKYVLIVRSDNFKIVLNILYRKSCRADIHRHRELLWKLLQGQTLGIELGQFLNAGVDIIYFIPRCFVHNSRLRKIEYTLEFPHCVCGLVVIGNVYRIYFRYSRIVSRYPVKLYFYAVHVRTAGTDSKRSTRISGDIRSYISVCHNIYIISVIICKYFIRRHSLICKVYASPLIKAVAGDFDTVAVCRKKRLNASLTYKILIKDIVNNTAYRFKDIAVFNK